jgi:hypothetical protein
VQPPFDSVQAMSNRENMFHLQHDRKTDIPVSHAIVAANIVLAVPVTTLRPYHGVFLRMLYRPCLPPDHQSTCPLICYAQQNHFFVIIAPPTKPPGVATIQGSPLFAAQCWASCTTLMKPRLVQRTMSGKAFGLLHSVPKPRCIPWLCALARFSTGRLISTVVTPCPHRQVPYPMIPSHEVLAHGHTPVACQGFTAPSLPPGVHTTLLT